LSRPKDVLTGIVLQYLIIPIVGFGVATLLRLLPIFLLLAGAEVHVNPSAMFMDVVKIVLPPVITGMVLRGLFSSFDRIMKIVPVISVIAIIWVIAIVVALSAAKLDTVAVIAFAAVPGAIFSVWHNFTGSIIAGYWQISRLNKSHQLLNC
jgi:BASS family bile acid:Na+ symporter